MAAEAVRALTNTAGCQTREGPLGLHPARPAQPRPDRERGRVDNRQMGPLEVRGHLSFSQDGRSGSPSRSLELVGI